MRLCFYLFQVYLTITSERTNRFLKLATRGYSFTLHNFTAFDIDHLKNRGAGGKSARGNNCEKITEARVSYHIEDNFNHNHII